MDRHIIPVPAANEGAPVVLEVKKHGFRPLDLRLSACEGENVYVTTIKQRNIGDWKRKGSNEEWEAVLSYFLLQKQPEGGKAGILDGVRMEYSPKGDDIQITVRRDVQGIKMTLGEFDLQQNSEIEIDPIDWAYTSAQAHNETLKEMADLKAKMTGEQGTIDKLNAQLDDFVKTKNETEKAMLQQFMELLNEKKRKIRDQSRLLAAAQVDQPIASAVHYSRQETKPRKAGPSRASKRKAPAKPAVAKQEEESDMDQMEMDESKAEERDEESGSEAATPDRSGDDGETEDEDDAGSHASTQQVTEVKLAEGNGNGNATAAQPLKPASTRTGPPPRRELPFGRPATRNQPQKEPSPPTVDDDDAETEDDEL